MTTKLTVVICSYNRYDVLPLAIKSLQVQTMASADLQIIVVDNSPDFEFSAEFSSDYINIPNLTWVIEKTPGLSNARNVGLEMATAPYIGFIDDDAIADPTWAEELVAGFEGFGEKAAVVGGKVIPIWGAPRPDWLHDDLLGYASAVDWGTETRPLKSNEWVAGTNISFRVAELKAVGGFSVALGRKGGGQVLLSNEETEVTDKLKEMGYLAIYAPKMIVQHLIEPGRLTQEWFRRRVTWQALSEYMKDPVNLFERCPDFFNDVTHFFEQLPPIERTPRGFFTPQADPDRFKAQLSALYNYTTCSLTGFRNLNDEVDA